MNQSLLPEPAKDPETYKILSDLHAAGYRIMFTVPAKHPSRTIPSRFWPPGGYPDKYLLSWDHADFEDPHSWNAFLTDRDGRTTKHGAGPTPEAAFLEAYLTFTLSELAVCE